MPGDAYGVFLLVASVCVVILTVLAVAVSAALLWASVELVRFIRLVRDETEHMIEAKERIARKARYAGRWSALFLEKAVSRFL